MKPDFIDRLYSNGLTYNQYVKRTIEDSEKVLPANASETEMHRHSLLKLNIQRMNRIDKTYSVSDELLSEMNKISEKQTWMIISEPWCGDSAQIIPVLAKIALTNTLIELKIILRDENPDIMDLYVTPENKRSIPVLAVFDNENNELFRWGSRPVKAEQLVFELREKGAAKEVYLNKLHLWYSQNKGAELEKEILSLLIHNSIVI